MRGTSGLLLRLLILWLAAAAACRAAPADSGTAAQLEHAARFRVDRAAVTAPLAPFSVSTAGFGNTEVGSFGGFEPVLVRDAFFASQDAEDRIYAPFEALSHWDVFAAPMLEEVEVAVWRVVNGAIRQVRVDRVRQGGAHFASWLPVQDDSHLIPAGTQRWLYQWPDVSRPDAVQYFMLRAVGFNGHSSEPSNAVHGASPHDPHAVRPAADSALIAFAAHPAGELSLPAAPVGLKAMLRPDGLLEFRWQPPPSAAIAGYRLYRSEYPPDLQQGTYLQLSGHAEDAEQRIRKGDWVMWHRKLYRVGAELFSQRIWGSGEGPQRYMEGLQWPPNETGGPAWTLERHPADSPVTDGGETYLRLTLRAGEKTFLGINDYSGTRNDWYDVLEPRPYQCSVWMRQQGSGQVRFVPQGPFGDSAPGIAPQELHVGSEWKMHVVQFTPPSVLDTNRAGGFGLELRGPGTFDIDNFAIRRADTPFLAMLPEDLSALQQAGMAALRTHAFIKSQTQGYDLEQYTNQGGAITGTPKRNTLPQTLAAMKAAGVNPWLQVELYFQPQDWRGLIEYLAAPFDPRSDSAADKPWAYKRYRQGHPAPWTDDFPRLYLELGNETWNSVFTPWVFPSLRDPVSHATYSAGSVYGLYQEQVIQTLKSSPWWTSAHLAQKLRFVLGGWLIQPDYGMDAARASPSSDFLTFAAYSGGWDWGAPPLPDRPESYFEVLNATNQTDIPLAEQYEKRLADLNRGRAHPLQLGTYEAGPGYALNGLNGAVVSADQNAQQDRVMKSLAAGTATLDAFLARAYHGFALQNFFGFSRGGQWGSHARWFDGGQAWPSWDLLSLFNREGTGSMLHTETLDVPRWPLPDVHARKARPDVPLVSAYALRRGSRVMLFLLSRKMPGVPLADSSGYTPVEVELPFRHFASVRVFSTQGKASDNNLDTYRVRIAEQSPAHLRLGAGTLRVDADSGADRRGLAPGSTLLYVFEGTDIDALR